MEKNKDSVHIRAEKRMRLKRKKKIEYLAIAITAFAAVIFAIVLATPSSPKTSAGRKANSNSVSESQTNQSNKRTPQNTESNSKSTAEIDYDYSKPVPKSDMVDSSYFDDAVFIGDSRTEGLILYTGLSNAVSYTNKGLMVDTVFTKAVINKNGKKLSVMDALKQTDFSKVYIMLGINEAGWPHSSVFIEKYGKIIDEIKTLNPKAVIYVQEILPVNDKVSQTHSYLKNGKINEYNALIRQMAEGKQVYYIDIGKAFAGVNGSLPEDAASDGIHLKKPYCEKWLEYLKTHTVTE